MNTKQIKHLEELLGRELTSEELDRFKRIKDILELSDDDALWDLLIAMEYQRTYYEKIPQKIQQVVENICQNIKEKAEQEVAIAQNKLAESVVKQAQSLSLRLNRTELVIWGTVLLVVYLLSGAALMWFGYLLGSGQTHSPAMLLRMPVGFIIGGLGFGAGILLMGLSAKNFSEGHNRWKRLLLIAAAFVAPGILFIIHTL